ncbi:MAG: elongation factor P [Candidatus Eisenbacteria bacterium]|uniref:Elongation factor P n=1 Tax=Eiseniibacteriota bacterium TaxID=2212470 RepID=A0A7Y2EEF9_UNCEI|nr:elongation factor P [Candidatus Eisenbacteria bacterium]
MAIPANQLKRGMVLVHNGKPHRVVNKQHVTPGKGQAVVQTDLQSLETGSIFNHRFRSAESVEPARLDTVELQFSYKQGDDYVFMNNETYEMITLGDDVLGDNTAYMQEELKINASYWEGKVVGIEVPLSLIFEITECDPPMKGATASGGPKPALLENGLTVKIPQHLNVGDKIKIDTRDNTFVEKA